MNIGSFNRYKLEVSPSHYQCTEVNGKKLNHFIAPDTNTGIKSYMWSKTVVKYSMWVSPLRVLAPGLGTDSKQLAKKVITAINGKIKSQRLNC